VVGLVVLAVEVIGDEQAPKDQVGKGVRNLAVGFEVGLYVLLHREGNVSVTDAFG
jgi:hypothetical protein